MDITLKLADFISSTSYNDLPNDVIGMIKNAIMDALGCGIFGSTADWSKIVLDYVLEHNGKPESSIWVYGNKVPASEAALVNGTMIHSFELDDLFHKGKVHPGAPTVSSAIAMAEKLGSSGKKLIEAVALGYEVMARTALALGPKQAKMRGWHITGVVGTLGAAAAAGKLLDLDVRRMAMALGLAGTQSSGLFAFTADGADSKRIHPGIAAQRGIMSAILAEKGFRGPTKILEAEDGGFLKAFSDGWSFEPITDQLGERWEILDLGFKLYSSCGSLHSMIDALLELKNRHGIKHDEVERVEVGTSEVVIQQCGWEYKPLSVLQAQMSLKYCASIALIDGRVFVDQFTEDRIRDNEVIEFTRKVNAYVDPKVNEVYPQKFAARVIVYLKNGTKYELYVDEPKGLSVKGDALRRELEEKFMILSSKVLGKERSVRIMNRLNDLESLNDVNILTSLLQKEQA